MIAMISPGLSSCEHTLNTLRYADRVKELGPRKENKYDCEEEDELDELPPSDVKVDGKAVRLP